MNERFHRAKDFFVFDVFPDPSPPVFVERRYFPHSEPMLRDFDGVAALLEDCRHLASLGFVGAAKRALAGKGFALHESRGEIAQVLWDIVSPQHDGEEP